LTTHLRALTFAVAVAAVCVLAPAAVSVVRKPAYGKAGDVRIVPIQGGVVNGAPAITFPKHRIKRSSKAPRDSQKICTTFQVLIPATPPATGWVVKASSKNYCAWNLPGSIEEIGDWVWPATPGVQYHGQFTVTWATKKKKKLARATYDFNGVNDYACVSTRCFVDQGTDLVPFISFLK
jgi:hypothetical protein